MTTPAIEAVLFDLDGTLYDRAARCRLLELLPIVDGNAGPSPRPEGGKAA